MNEIKKLMKQGVTLILAGEKCDIKPLVLDNYILMIGEIFEVVKVVVKQNPNIDFDNFQASDIAVFAPALADPLRRIIAVSVGRGEKWVGANFTLRDITSATLAIVQVNDIKEVVQNFGQLKRELGLGQTRKKEKVPSLQQSPK